MNLRITSGSEKTDGKLALEKRFDAGMAVGALKQKLFMIVGVAPEHQRLSVYDSSDVRVAQLDDDSKTLEAEGVRAEMRIHVTDTSGNTVALTEDLSSVPKYVMSDEDYNKREDSYRKFKERQNQQKQSEKSEEKPAVRVPVVGERCLVESGHRGEVAFVGEIPGKPGVFVGVRLDDPFGLNDGTVAGVRYFEALPKCGVFVRPEKVQVGDFPPMEDDVF